MSTGQSAGRSQFSAQFNPQFSALAMPGLDDGAVFSKGVEPAFKAAARTNLELMTFASKRAQAMVALPSRMAACRTPHDVVNEQIRFWQTAFSQYAETTRTIATAWSAVNPAARMVAAQMENWQRQNDVTRKEPVKAIHELITFPEPKVTREERPQGAGRSPELVAASAA